MAEARSEMILCVDNGQLSHMCSKDLMEIWEMLQVGFCIGMGLPKVFGSWVMWVQVWFLIWVPCENHTLNQVSQLLIVLKLIWWVHRLHFNFRVLLGVTG